MPVYQASGRVTSLIESLIRQKIEIPFEIVVVDDASTDDTAEKVTALIRRTGFPPVQFFRLPKNEGPAGARNFAIANAKGDVFLLIDSDCFFLSDTHLAELWKEHLAHPAALIGGGVRGKGRGYIAFSDHFCHWATNIPGKTDEKGIRHLVTAHLLIPRGAWEKIGPFEKIRTGEDAILCFKARRAKVPMKLKGDIVLGHYDRENFGDFMRCFYLCGKDRAATRKLVYGKSPWFLSGPKAVRFLAMPIIAAGLTLSHLKSWWHYDKRVVLALPAIFAGMTAMAYGVFVGDEAKC